MLLDGVNGGGPACFSGGAAVSRRPLHTPPATLASFAGGVVVGRLHGSSLPDGLCVDYSGNDHGPLPARTTVPLSADAIEAAPPRLHDDRSRLADRDLQARRTDHLDGIEGPGIARFGFHRSAVALFMIATGREGQGGQQDPGQARQVVRHDSVPDSNVARIVRRRARGSKSRPANGGTVPVNDHGRAQEPLRANVSE